MYEEFYGLSEKPFSLTPNPRFVFQSDQYRTAEESLIYGIGQKEGFMLVTGAPVTSMKPSFWAMPYRRASSAVRY